jgi:hypothetical protein
MSVTLSTSVVIDGVSTGSSAMGSISFISAKWSQSHEGTATRSKQLLT